MRMRLCSLCCCLWPGRRLPIQLQFCIRFANSLFLCRFSFDPVLANRNYSRAQVKQNRIRAPLPKTKTDSNSKLDYRLWSAADLLKIVRTTSRRSWKTGNVWTLCERSARSQKLHRPVRRVFACVMCARQCEWVRCRAWAAILLAHTLIPQLSRSGKWRRSQLLASVARSRSRAQPVDEEGVVFYPRSRTSRNRLPTHRPPDSWPAAKRE